VIFPIFSSVRSVRFCETTFRKHVLKAFYFQAAFPGAPCRLRFNFWYWRFI